MMKQLIILVFIVAMTSCGTKKSSQKGSSHGDSHKSTTESKETEHPASKHAIHWGYTGEGSPDNWSTLKPEYQVCANGKNQSPIDIQKAVKSKTLKDIQFNYKDTNLGVLNNGHTIQVNYAPGSFAVIGGKKYNLLQFHFHSPSEHTLSGKPYPLEMHLVHKGADGLAVVGVFFKDGKENPFLKDIWANMPSEHNKPKATSVKINALKALPAKKGYFHYSGSLTTPPCSEGVNWNVLSTPVEASGSQVKSFLDLIKANARPVQPLNGRVIQEK